MEDKRGIRVAGVLIISLFSWLFLGSFIAYLFSSFSFFNTPLGSFILLFAPYLCFFSSLLISSKLLLKTNLITILREQGVRRKKTLIFSFVYLLCLIGITISNYKSITLNPAPLLSRVIFILPSLILIPMATLSEEIFFRALIVNTFTEKGKTLKNLFVLLFSSLLFTIPHLINPEATNIYAVLYYFLWGFLSSLLGFIFSGYDITWGIHTINNLYVALVVNSPVSALPTEALFINKGNSTSIKELINLIIVFSLLFLTGFILKKKDRE